MARAPKWDSKEVEALLAAVLELRNAAEARRFFRDLLTEAELKEFANRWEAARLLAQGVSYVEIEKRTGMSSTTIARIQKWLKKGMGGYRLILGRTKA